MHCTLVNSVTGVSIPLRTPRVHTTYADTGHYSGYSVFEFRLESPGEYSFTCNYLDGSASEQVVFAVGPDNTGDIFKLVFLEMVVLFLGLGAGAAAIALIIAKGISRWGLPGFNRLLGGVGTLRCLSRIEDRIRNPCDLHHFDNVMHANDVYTAQNACRDRRRRAPDAFFGRSRLAIASERGPKKSFARRADKQRIP
jgi:hypothetical protein